MAKPKSSEGHSPAQNPPENTNPVAYRIPTPATKPPFAVSPVFGFLFARRGNGTHGLYRLVTDPEGNVLEMKQVFEGTTRMVIKAMVMCLRTINLDGTFRTGILTEMKSLIREKKEPGK